MSVPPDPDSELEASSNGVESGRADALRVLEVLPEVVYADCLGLDRIDPEVLLDDAHIVHVTFGPVERYLSLGPGKISESIFDQTPDQLAEFSRRAGLIADMATLSNALGEHEAVALAASQELLAAVRSQRQADTEKQRSAASRRRDDVLAQLALDRAELASLEEQELRLPDLKSMADELERAEAEVEISRVRNLMLFVQSAIRTGEAQVDLFETMAGSASDAADELTLLFDDGWLAVGDELAKARRERGTVTRRRRRMRWAVNALVAVGLLGIATSVEKLTEQFVGVTIVTLLVVLGYGLFERKVIEPRIARHDLARRSEQMCTEMMLCGCSWVLMRNHQARLNSYAGTAQPQADLMPAILKRPAAV